MKKHKKIPWLVALTKPRTKFKKGDRVKLTGPAMEHLSYRNPGYREAGRVAGTDRGRVVIRYPNLAEVSCIPRFLKKVR